MVSGAAAPVAVLGLLAAAYLLGKSQAVSDAGSAGNKKKKPKKKSTKAKSSAETKQEGAPAPEKPSAKALDQRTSTPGVQTPRNKTDAKSKPQKESKVNDDEFPALSAATGKRNDSTPRPLAERKAKAPPKTGVEDMMDRDIEPERTFARTMRIVKPQQDAPLVIDQPADDWESHPDEREQGNRHRENHDAWQTVPAAVTKKPNQIRISTSSATSSSATPKHVVSVPGLTEPSKKQRQNAARAQAAKDAKEAAERERLAKLAAHKRQLENERSKVQQKDREREQQRNRTKRETLSGGMTAKVSDTGALIWD